MRKSKPRIEWAAVSKYGWVYCSTIRPTRKQCKAHFVARFFESSGEDGTKKFGITFRKVKVELV